MGSCSFEDSAAGLLLGGSDVSRRAATGLLVGSWNRKTAGRPAVTGMSQLLGGNFDGGGEEHWVTKEGRLIGDQKKENGSKYASTAKCGVLPFLPSTTHCEHRSGHCAKNEAFVAKTEVAIAKADRFIAKADRFVAEADRFDAKAYRFVAKAYRLDAEAYRFVAKIAAVVGDAEADVAAGSGLSAGLGREVEEVVRHS